MIQTGQILNDTYEIIERLGSGSGGIIFKAYHRRMQKYVAIKLIKDDIKEKLNNRSEVDVLKNLKNDYLPQVHDFIEDGGEVYTVMEFIEGKDLKRIVRNGRRFDEEDVRKYALQLCEAVGYLHDHRPPIIHSDIKPSNIMLTPEDNICLIDFNISMMANNGIAESIGGTKGYAAPEQFRRVIVAPETVDEFHEETRFLTDSETEILDESNSSFVQKAYIDIRTDIYGIGASLYYILTGRAPNGERLDFSGTRCSAGMKSVIKKCMAADPKKRFKNVHELCNALKIRTGKMPVIIGASSVMVAALVVVVATLVLNNNTSGDIETDVIVSKTTASVTTEKTVVTTAPPATIAKTTTNTTTAVKENRPVKVKIGEKEYSTSLKKLDLSQRNLTDKDIESIGEFTNLYLLYLGINRISDISSLSGLTQLNELYLYQNQISDISALSGLTNLTQLYLYQNNISDISALSGLTNLRYLWLQDNNISDISPLSGLTNLTELYLDYTGISDITPLKKLTNLKILDISGNNISDSDINELKKALPDCEIIY